MSQITDFRLSCCHLMAQVPLYRFRMPQTDGTRQRLSVLLLGYGSRMDVLLQTVITQGQLLDTDLDITLANTNPKGTLSSLLKRAPAMPQFSTLLLEGKPVEADACTQSLCTLRFEEVYLVPQAMERALECFYDVSYVLISTGDDQLNHDLAAACAACDPDHRIFVSYVQNRDLEQITGSSPLLQAQALRASCGAEYRAQLEQIALNMHYSYEKQQNDRASAASIFAHFQDPYIHASNLEAALHIRAKLACCGIEANSADSAAAQFNILLQQQPQLLDRLAALEHQRWVLSKLLDGFVPMDSLSQIYRDGAGTHDSRKKWHACLVPCDPEGRSRVRASDWDAPSIRPELDALDRRTLQLHQHCKVLAEATRSQVDLLLQALTDAVQHAEQMAAALPLVRELRLCMLHLWQHKQPAVARYHRLISQLRSRIQADGGLLTELLLQHLSNLDSATMPLLEYVSCKDYKLQDRIAVQQIPFALTHRPAPRLVKVLAENRADTLFSTWQLEPEQVVFVGAARSALQLEHLLQRAADDCAFLRDALPGLHPTYVVCVPSGLSVSPAASRNCTLVSIGQWQVSAMAQQLAAALPALSGDYLDVTGGDPALSRALEQVLISRGASSFYVQNSRFYSLSGASELEYIRPGKGITVSEMFSLAGTLPVSCESQTYSDLSYCYQDLWKIEQRNHGTWSSFCEELMRSYNATQKEIGSLLLPVPDAGTPITRVFRFSSVPHVALQPLLPVLQAMEQQNLLQDLSWSKEAGSLPYDGYEAVTFAASLAPESAASLQAYLENCFSRYRPGLHYGFRNRANGVQLSCEELTVEAMPSVKTLPNGYELRYYYILNALNDAGLIQNYVSDPMTKNASFRFNSPEVLHLFEKAGNVLEVFLYYTALFEAHFDDVEMSYEFRHSSRESSALNEIDVICTKGSGSLFISAKLRGQEAFQKEFNYMLYEISLLAREFGLAPKVALAAPALPQFEYQADGTRVLSQHVRKAMSRGVYLLGDACMKNGHLGKILDRIMDGAENWCDF